MCFTATASFTATAILLPTGLYACNLARDKDLRYLPLALVPCGFALQQGLEGIEWLALTDGRVNMLRGAALGYLGFSHGFWLVWLPFSVWVLEARSRVKTSISIVVLLGAIFAISLYGPFLLSSNTFSPIIDRGSIDYQTKLIYDPFLPRDITRAIYMAIVLGPLWFAEQTQLKLLGGFGALSLVIAYGLYNYAFVSVWCFFAAILSFGVVYLLHTMLRNSVGEGAA